jgi:hypothetical protein
MQIFRRDFENRSNILVRAENELSLIRTLAVERDDIDKFHTCADKGSMNTSIILEPLQTWTITEPNERKGNIISLGVSSSSIPYASLLTNSSLLHSWSPDEGLRLHSNEPLFPGLASHSQSSNPCIRCSLHIPIHWCSYMNAVYSIDTRARNSSIRSNALFQTSQQISSIMQHPKVADYLFVGMKGSLALVDVR